MLPPDSRSSSVFPQSAPHSGRGLSMLPFAPNLGLFLCSSSFTHTPRLPARPAGRALRHTCPHRPGVQPHVHHRHRPPSSLAPPSGHRSANRLSLLDAGLQGRPLPLGASSVSPRESLISPGSSLTPSSLLPAEETHGWATSPWETFGENYQGKGTQSRNPTPLHRHWDGENRRDRLRRGLAGDRGSRDPRPLPVRVGSRVAGSGDSSAAPRDARRGVAVGTRTPAPGACPGPRAHADPCVAAR